MKKESLEHLHGVWENEKLKDSIAAKSVQKEDGCIEYSGYKNKKGYPRCCFKNNGLTRTQSVSRVIWSIENKRVPKPRELICHTCDNPNCINPNHLWLGTNCDNMRDMKIKNRAQKGFDHAHAVTDENILREIKGMIDRGDQTKDISALTGVSMSTVYLIKNNIHFTSIKDIGEDKKLMIFRFADKLNYTARNRHLFSFFNGYQAGYNDPDHKLLLEECEKFLETMHESVFWITPDKRKLINHEQISELLQKLKAVRG